MPTPYVAPYVAPYVPAFQKGHRYDIALPHRPGPGQTPWPGVMPPQVARPTEKKGVSFAPTPARSQTMPVFASGSSTRSSLPSPPRPVPAAAPRAGFASVHPLLAYNPKTTLLRWDITRDPRSIPIAASARSESATTPARLSHLRVTISGLPAGWSVDVADRTGLGVTIDAVLNAVFASLQHRIRSSEWASLSESKKARVTRAWQTRCARMGAYAQAEASAGVRRVDCLDGATLWMGLAQTSEPNTWMLVLQAT